MSNQLISHNRLRCSLRACLVMLLLLPTFAFAQPATKPLVREIFVPFDSLSVLIDSKLQRVFLNRAEYEALLKKAQPAAQRQAPFATSVLAADYTAKIDGSRISITGNLSIDILKPGLHAIPLQLSGVELQTATLDGKSALMARTNGKMVQLFVSGVGRHKLQLKMVASVTISAALQSMSFQLPVGATSKLSMSVPGNVEVKSGAQVVRRSVDAKNSTTTFDFLLSRAPLSIVMSLNNHLLQQQQVIVARSTQIDDISVADEALHANVTLDVLHGATREITLQVPTEFDVTNVRCAQMSRWNLVRQNGKKHVVVTFREALTKSTNVAIEAHRKPNLTTWAMPQVQPLHVAGHVAVVGVVASRQLSAKRFHSQALIPIDNTRIRSSVKDRKRDRALVAYYAPDARKFQLSGELYRPPIKLSVESSTLLVVDEKQHQVMGSISASAQGEKLFAVEFAAPNGWVVTRVTGENGQPMKFERSEAANGSSRIRVRLPKSVAPGTPATLLFYAESTPTGWLSPWQERVYSFPKFPVQGSADVRGAIAVQMLGDVNLQPENANELIPLEEKDRKRYGLSTSSVAAAYQYDRGDYSLNLRFRRKLSSMSAETFSFFSLTRGKLRARFELIYQIRRARSSQLVFTLPTSTPNNISIRAIRGANVKETSHKDDGAVREWTVQLANPSLDTVHLAIDYEQEARVNPSTEIKLPRISAKGVRFQTGMVAVEGHPDFGVDVNTKARTVDVGEMVAAKYVPGKFLLGAFRLVGVEDDLTLDVTRRTEFSLPKAIIQRASLDTLVATNGQMVTHAKYQIRTNAMFIEASLPADSKLWSVTLDGKPLTPQSSKNALILGMTQTKIGALQILEVVYQSPGNKILPWGRLKVPALVIAARSGNKTTPVPIADVHWRVLLPKGVKVTSSSGNVQRVKVKSRHMPIVKVAGALHYIAGENNGWRSFSESRDSSASSRGWTFFPPIFGGGAKKDKMVAKKSAMKKSKGRRSFPEESDELSHFMPQASGTTNAPSSVELPRKKSPGRSKSKSRKSDRAGGGARGPGRAGMGGGMAGGGLATQKAAKVPSLTKATRERIKLQSGKDPFAARAVLDSKGEDSAKKDDSKSAPRFNDLDDAGMNGVVDNSQSMGQGQGKSRILPADWTLEGVRSLNMNVSMILDQSDGVVAFHSLGEAPELDISVGDDTRLNYFSWLVALAVGFVGVLLTRSSASGKSSYVISVLIVTAVAPLATGMVNETGKVFDFGFFAGIALIGYYILAHFGSATRQAFIRTWFRPTTTAATLLILTLAFVPTTAMAQGGKAPAGQQAKINIPQDAVIIPYDPSKGIENATKAKRILLPYTKYIQLLRLANPTKAAQIGTPIVPFAFAGSDYSITLSNNKHLLVQGKVDIEVFAKGEVLIPLKLAGGVLMSVELDGKPAQVRLAGAAKRKNPNLIVLLVNKPGRHTIEVAIRFGLTKQGGWRQLTGQVPTGVASKLTITVPEADTDVRLVGIRDRNQIQTSKANQRVVTAVGSSGFSIQWRPKVTSGDVDQSLSANSLALVDVRDDGVRVIWRTTLSYRRGRRGSFTVVVPAEYLVEDVTGSNIRGWKALQGKNPGDPQQIDITLLNAVANGASLYVHLAKRGTVTTDIQQFNVPVVKVQDIVLHRGRVVLRRSPLVKLRSTESNGLNRTNNVQTADLEKQSTGWQASPSGIQLFQTLEFASEQFRLSYSAVPVPNTTVARLQTILRVSDTRTDFESRVSFRGQSRPIHEVSVRIPRDLQLKQVLPAGLEWNIEEDFTFRQLTVRMPTGRRGQFVIGLVGQLPTGINSQTLELPRVIVENVRDQQVEVVVQGDPTMRVSASDLRDTERLFSNQAGSWLSKTQSQLAKLVLRCRGEEYDGTLNLTVNRTPKIECTTITNVHVTDHATIEESILMSYNITNAGTRQIQFQLPAALRNSIFRAQKVRRIAITETGAAGTDPILVTLQLQEEVMGQFLVVIENDRLLTLTKHDVSVPKLMTGSATDQLVTLQYRGRDEMEETVAGFEELNRQQRRWKQLVSKFPVVLKTNISKVYTARRDAQNLSLGFQAKPRPELKTAGARIGLATTLLVVDATGAYRAEQVFQLNNQTEQYLEVELPEGATLWSATVSRTPIRTTVSPTSTNHVRIPLVKTATGAQDYPVKVVYGGKLQVGWYSSVKFPMARTTNINVELSRLRLFLPKTHKWMRFDGAERQNNQDEFEARELMYLNSQVERASQALQSSNYFDNARAQATLKKLQKQVNETQRRLGHLSNNDSISRNNTVLDRNLAAAQSQLQVFSPKTEQATPQSNRARFNSLLEQQKTQRSSNITKSLGNNFRYGGSNSSGKPSKHKTPMQQLQQQFSKLTTKNEAGRNSSSRQKNGKGKWGRANRDNNFQRAQSYQSRLEKNVQGVPPQSPNSWISGSTGGQNVLHSADTSGMASLDVTIPQRGTEILFVSPRGDLQLKSTALRSDIVQRLQRLGILLLVGIACAVAFAGRKPIKKMASSRLGAALLAILGVVCLIGNIYPIAGLLLAIVSVVVAIRGKSTSHS